MRKEFRVSGLAEPISHYTDAVQFGDILFISGCAATDKDGNLIGGDDVAAQARQALRNMEAILRAVNASFADVLKVTVYLTNVEDRTKINPVRKEFFGSARPASTLVQVSRLALPGLKVEIEAVAGVRSGSQ